MKPIKSLVQAIQYFSDPANCRDYALALRWPDGVVCPKCGSRDVLFLEKYNRWHCRAKHASPQFTLKTGTVMEDSAIPLGKWFVAMWMLANCRNGLSSHELARTLGVTQKSAWFMLHRIRAAMKTQALPGSMGSAEGGEVEVDETYVGALPQRMNRKARARYNQRRNEAESKGAYTSLSSKFRWGKTPVQGILDRDAGTVRTFVVPDTRRETLMAAILDNVAAGSRVYTDEHVSYSAMEGEYVHRVVNHLEGYVSGRVHTNGLENFWSLLKRGLRGTYVAVEPFHLDRYVDEQVFRYNNRATKSNPLSDEDRFALAVSQVAGKRLTYKELTGKEGETAAL